MNTKWKIAVVAGLAGLATYSASAITLLSDNFNYPDGNLVGAPGSPWVSHSGSTPVLVTNSQIEINRSRSEDVNATLSGAPYSTNSATSLYSSFTIECLELPSANGAYLAHFRSATSFRYPCRIVSTVSNAAPGNFRLAIGNGTQWSPATGQFPLDLSTGTVYTVVTRLVLSSGQCTLWIDPTLESDTSVDGTDLLTPDDIDQYAFRQASGEGIMRVDNLKIGTSFADVAGPNNAPTISAIADQSIGQDTSTGPLDFTVSDAETPAGSLNVTAVSGNTTLIPNLPANLSLGGSGTDRTVTVTPAAGQQGSGLITLTVDDGVLTNSTQFTVNVGYPTISAIANQTTPENGVAGPIAFLVGDGETAAGSLTVTANSTNTTLVPNGNIVISNLGGSNRTVTITPTANVGATEITLTVDDGTLTAETKFMVTVYPEVGVILSDDFSYADGSLNQVSLGKWANHSGTLDETQVTNGVVLLSGAQGEDVNAVLTDGSVFPPFEASGGYVLYSRFVVNFSGYPSSFGNYFAHFKNLTTGFRARVMAGTGEATPGFFRLGVQSSGSPTAWLSRDLALGVPYVVITRYNTVTADSTLWVNPVTESDASAEAPGNFPTSLYQYAFRQSGGIGDLAVDDLVVGTSFSDVVIAVPSESLDYAQSGGNLVLSWTQPLLTLESATNVAGPYLPVAGATSPYTNAIAGDQMYFRLKY